MFSRNLCALLQRLTLAHLRKELMQRKKVLFVALWDKNLNILLSEIKHLQILSLTVSYPAVIKTHFITYTMDVTKYLVSSVSPEFKCKYSKTGQSAEMWFWHLGKDKMTVQSTATVINDEFWVVIRKIIWYCKRCVALAGDVQPKLFIWYYLSTVIYRFIILKYI